MSREKFSKENRAVASAIGARIEEALRGRTSAWLAAEIGKAPARVSEWIAGKKLIRIDTLQRISEVTGCDFLWLATGQTASARKVSEIHNYSVPPPGVDPEAWPALLEHLPLLSLIYEAQALHAHAQRWEWIHGNMVTFSDIVRSDVERLRREKKRTRHSG